jgi:hypothetical protein
MTESTDHRRFAKRMLQSGAQVPEVEAALVARGLEHQGAPSVLDDALRSNLAAATPPEPARSFSVAKVLLGLCLAAVAFVGIYVALSGSSENVVLGVGALPGAVRGAIIGGGGGLAAAGLNLVRSELMLLLK